MASKRPMDGSMCDNGVVGGIGDVPPRKSRKKNTKLETALKELAAAKASNALLSAEWNKAQETIKNLQSTSKAPGSEASSDVNTDEFIDIIGPSSTHRDRNTRETTEISRFMSSVNQMSVSSITVPECKPSSGSEMIGRQDFEAWRDLLVDSMKLAGITDEGTQYILLKVKAGQQLLEILKTRSQLAMLPDPDEFLFRMLCFG
ncbi:uncharacterized protein LOC134221401 [Armigeres subalbatus]|uniref:uncharacterized protein LOC134221401 n=1 Tax=Armigeres subalbatus TaxID=124917 RepID=UPI002ED4D4F3